MPHVRPPTAAPTPNAALAPVQRVAEGGREREGLVGLDRNERLSPLPDAVLAELREAIGSDLLTRYPSTDELYDELAAFLELSRERLLLTPGSDAGVRALHHGYVRSGDRTLMLSPSYAMYPIYGRMFGAEPVEIAFADDLSLDGGALLDAVRPGVRAIFIADPNQPTGTRLPDGVLPELVARAEAIGALVVVDEAYFPFSGTTVLPWVAEHANLVVLRTFSKAWGLAGLRAGVACAAPDVIRTLYKVRTAYDVNAAAVLALRTFIAHPEVAADYVAEVDAGRELLRARLSALGLEPLGDGTNFQVFRVTARADPGELAAALERRGFLVKGPFSVRCLAGCLRATLGPPELMQRFADALEDALA
jgi:histidinol-phosphate aminotransferase